MSRIEQLSHYKGYETTYRVRIRLPMLQIVDIDGLTRI